MASMNPFLVCAAFSTNVIVFLTAICLMLPLKLVSRLILKGPHQIASRKKRCRKLPIGFFTHESLGRSSLKCIAYTVFLSMSARGFYQDSLVNRNPELPNNCGIIPVIK